MLHAPAFRRLDRGLAVLLALALWCGIVPAQESQPEMSVAELGRALDRANAAVVGVEVEAVDDARSAATLGTQRSGSGVVISSDGLVLTIGYLILEADRVELTVGGERKLPARVVAYDVATGFGLVQALVPLAVAPVPLGDAATLQPSEPMMVSSGGSAGEVSMATLVSRRPFSGYWEYHIDSALYTAPPRSDHSGAGLFNTRGELVGIGSLLLTDTLGDEGGAAHPKVPGNLFVPVDLLKPILGEMRSSGSSHLSHRAWMGLNCIEIDGQVRVMNVSDDSPGFVAGVERGDRIVRIDGAEVRTLETLWKTLWGRDQRAEREVTLDITRGDEPRTLKLQSVDRMKTLRHAQGI